MTVLEFVINLCFGINKSIYIQFNELSFFVQMLLVLCIYIYNILVDQFIGRPKIEYLIE